MLFQLVTIALLVLVCTAIWIVYDGLSDHGDRADAAVVLGNAVLRNGLPGAVLRDRLDHAVELYQKGEFPIIIVSGATKLGGYNEPAAMANYLIEHQVPATAVIQDKKGINTMATGVDVARIMKTRHLNSVMIITNYYHVTRSKLALEHAGITDVEQSHVGAVAKDDAFMLARETAGLYYYLYQFYALPFIEQAQTKITSDSEKIKEDAQVEADKARDAADKAKDHVDQDFQNVNK
jgi:vancomycin permeability regulator SanA